MTMHEPCQCCGTALKVIGETEPTADGDHLVTRYKCPSCQRGGSKYRTPTGALAGSIGPVFKAAQYRIDTRRQPTTSVDHSRVATDGGEQR